jgi:hypothetical protein
MRYNVYIPLHLDSHKPGVTRRRHIYKREYDQIGYAIKKGLIDVLRKHGVKSDRVTFFMCTDFKRNTDRTMHISLNVPRFHSKLGLHAGLVKALGGMKYVCDFKIESCSPRYLPFGLGKVVTYVCD